jgi:hypothetical protein
MHSELLLLRIENGFDVSSLFVCRIGLVEMPALARVALVR